MKAICISASNMAGSSSKSTSYKLCDKVKSELEINGIACEILDLREFNLSPCIGCGKCYENKRCCMDDGFNTIYNKIAESDCVFFISPHYAPIPAKLCMLLEKMEEITFLHWWKDNTYKSEMYDIPAGIISHGGGSDWALSSYKAMVNDTIANALDTIQCKLIPLNNKWNTGITIPVYNVEQGNDVFPVQHYEWKVIEEKIQEYVRRVVKEIKYKEGSTEQFVKTEHQIESQLLDNLDKLHTTESGIVQIKRNLSLDTDNVVEWCKDKITSANAIITRNGKNWYIEADDCIITVNVHSYTIITAHREKK